MPQRFRQMACVLNRTQTLPPTMNPITRITLAYASVSLIGSGLLHADIKTPEIKLTSEEFHTRLQRDDTPLPAGGQLQMSYAGVVDKILPSVVTIFAYGEKAGTSIQGHGGMPDLDQVPPMFREYFEEWFRQQQEEGGGGETPQRPNPRGRRGQQREEPEQDKKLEPSGVGSGFIVSTDGYILTNNHVVGEADKIEVVVTINGSTKRHDAKVIGADPQTDVALIKISASGLPAATLADSSKLRVGDIVLALGAPMELSRSVTQGIVSALGRSGMGIIGRRDMQGYEDFIQTDASINPGNSGGPLVDAMGRVIGINTAIYSRSGMNAGIGFSIPINLALRIAEDLTDDGEVTRGFLGILPADIDSEIAKIYNLSDESGALVRKVTKNSPAARAGLQVGDVILSVSGQKVETASKLPVIVSSYKPGSEIALEVLRDGKPFTVTAKLAKLTPEIIAGSETVEEDKTPSGPDKSSASVGEILPGVTIQNLTPGTRERYEVPEDITGVIITQIDPNSRAAAMGVEEGDVITQVNRKPVRAVGEARQMSKDSGKTVLLKAWRKGETMLFMVGSN
jgi:Do/DeqQ family serine protease